MRCPWCGSLESKVVDSRTAEDGEAIRRRRQCDSCGRRFTTYERSEDVALSVVKRDGSKTPYDRAKVIAGITKAMTNRPFTEADVARLADRIEEKLRRKGPNVTTQEVGLEVLAHLRRADEVAYLRFASVYKDFKEISDFEREVGMLLQKRQPAKRAR
ncbi:MAG: transcriptional regulator NrdR [Actinomycetota bacterium]